MNYLERIVDRKRVQIARTKENPGASKFADSAMYHAPTRSLIESLAGRSPVAIIAEIKRSSPSTGPLRDVADPAAIARSYEANGAAAISVLTDTEFFGADQADLPAVREAVALPVLRKDFIVDEYQIHESKSMGADAVLLIASILERSQLRDLHAAAVGIGLECLVEVGDVEEIDKVDFGTMRIVGANNRNLKTMQIDFGRTRAIARILPRNVLIVSESGFKAPADVARVAGWGARAALIGSQLMRSVDPGAELKKFVRFIHDGGRDEN